MHGICFDYELQEWFDFKIPKTKIAPDYILSCLEKENNFHIKPTSKIVWIGGKPSSESFTKSKKGQSWDMMKLTFHTKIETVEISLEKEKAIWLIELLDKISVTTTKVFTFSQVKQDFEMHFEDFELFWYAKTIKTLRNAGLLVL
jgi:hypothetical protein